MRAKIRIPGKSTSRAGAGASSALLVPLDGLVRASFGDLHPPASGARTASIHQLRGHALTAKVY